MSDVLIEFPDWYKGPYEAEVEAKGYLRDVRLAYAGIVFWLTIIDEFTHDQDRGFDDEHPVVVPSVRREVIEERIKALVLDGRIGEFEDRRDRGPGVPTGGF
jgi:hypothetical protein